MFSSEGEETSGRCINNGSFVLLFLFFIFVKADHVSRLSRWYTTNDQFAPSDPCLFCDKCFRMMHYDAQGNKLGEFLAYPYVDRGAFN